MVYVILILLALVTVNCGQDPSFVEQEGVEDARVDGQGDQNSTDLSPSGSENPAPDPEIIFDPLDPSHPDNPDAPDNGGEDPAVDPETPTNPIYESYAKTFAVAGEQQHSGNATYESLQFEQNLTLAGTIEEKQIEFRQDSRP